MMEHNPTFREGGIRERVEGMAGLRIRTLRWTLFRGMPYMTPQFGPWGSTLCDLATVVAAFLLWDGAAVEYMHKQ